MMGRARSYLAVIPWVLLALLLRPRADAQKPEPAVEQERARQFVLAGKPLEAIPIYSDLLRASPNNVTLRMNLAIAHFKAGQYETAIPLCRDAAQANPALASAWLFLGASYFQLHRPADAVEPLKHAVDLQPSERNARLMLGEALLLTSRVSEAAVHLEAVSKLQPESPRVWYALERSYTELSLRAGSDIETRTPDSAYLAALAGDSALRRHRHGLALHYYSEALRRDPGLPGIHRAMAEVYRAAGKPEWASLVGQREPERACETESPACRYSQGAYESCVRLADSPASPENSYWKAKAYRQLASFALSRLEALPPSPQLLELRARALDEAGRYREAAQRWREALGPAEDNPVVEKGLALSLMNARDYSSAVPALEKLRRTQPDSAEILTLLGEAYLVLEQSEKAVEQFRLAMKLTANSPAAAAALGGALLRAGKVEEAIPHLQAGLAGDPDGVRHFQLARAYQLTGRRDRAEVMLAEYRRLTAASEAARKETEREYELTPP